MARILGVLTALALVAAPQAFAGEGMVSVRSPRGAAATADRLERILKERGMTVFARIDHAEGARGAGMELRPTEVLVFGNPKAGTLLMQCRQGVGIDLPLKMLVWEDEKGTVWISYNGTGYLKERHGIAGCDEVLGKIGGALEKMAADAARPDP